MTAGAGLSSGVERSDNLRTRVKGEADLRAEPAAASAVESCQGDALWRFGAKRQKKMGTRDARPQSLWLKGLLLFLAALFLSTFFLGCHVSILPFHCSWMCG